MEDYKNEHATTGGKSNICPVVYKEIDTKNTSLMYIGFKSSVLRLNHNTYMVCYGYTGSNKDTMSFRPWKIRPIVRATKFRIDGFASSTITSDSGKVMLI